jgi:ABC-type lipoprotein export system ATPase subunit
MENFTAYENISLSRMIKESKSETEVLPGAKELMKKVNLPESEVNETTLAVNLSGGQRQRIAFVRALNTGAHVLLGDEPTGNLDEANANELMKLIRSNLSENLSAIIVSHDINLALAHADNMVLITKDKSKGYGVIEAENIFHRSQWESLSQVELNNFRNKIKSLYQTNLDSQTHTISGSSSKKSYYKNYFTLFLSKESKAIAGKNFSNLIVLCGILFFTFLAIGFANGCLDYLHKKLDSAFTNWLQISIPASRGGQETINLIKNTLENEELKKQYAYSTISATKEFSLRVNYQNSDNIEYAKCRTLDIGKDLNLINDYILGPKNIIRGRTDNLFKEDLSIIITESFFSKLGYSPEDDYLYIRNTIIDTATNTETHLRIPIPIRAIVKELPGKNNIAVSEFFYPVYTNKIDDVFDITKKDKNVNLVLYCNESKAFEIKNKLNEFFKSLSAFEYNDPKIISNPSPHIASFKDGYDLTINLMEPFRNKNERETFYKIIQESDILKEVPFKIVYNYDDAVASTSDYKYDFLSIYFSKLDSVRSFSDFIFKRFNDKDETSRNVIEVDLAKVKEKENFNFLSKITQIISYLVILFGTITVSLFLFNLLKLHLNKVKMNIGTFMAIGLGNRDSLRIYFTIILYFIITGILLSGLLAYITGITIDKLLKQNFTVESDVSYFILWDTFTYVTVVVIFITSITVSSFIINKMLSKTPGDLIYNR